METTVAHAKSALDSLIKKSRVHFYKPIQIGEILYHDRIYGDIDLDDLESYRNISKRWRDEITIALLGRRCTSSARFQDDLFNANAIPPECIKVLAHENRRTNGAVEAYIYRSFNNKHIQLSNALSYIDNSTNASFNLKCFIDLFWKEPGLKRSIDKIYEVIVYSLFSTLVEALDLKVEVHIDSSMFDMLAEFSEFASKVMCIDTSHPIATANAKVYRVGTTNAADRGLDMYSNWGPAIQIKHLSLDEELAETIVTSIASDRIVIVCKDVDKKIILSLLNQIGWKSRIQSIVTESNLIEWYDKALRGKYADSLGNVLLSKMKDELTAEFPSIDETPDIIKDRHYESVAEWNASMVQ